MARISNNELDRLKREVALVRLVESSGIELKKHGKDYLGLCPFHDDKEPSLVISPDKNLWHCLGACSEGGDVIQWVMKRQGVSFRHAVELLKDGDAALSVPATPVKRNTTAKHSASLAANPDDQKQLAVVIDYYHETLKQSPDALDYLKSRGLDHPELVDTFKLGYANRTLGYRLPEKNRKAGAEVRGQLQQIGILRKSGHEHFSGSLVIPIISPEGIITEVYGRKLLGAKLRKGTPQHLYLPGAHAGVFNEQALQVSDEIILCESLIDALTFWVAGYRNVTASYGTSGFTDDHLAAFKQHGIKRVLIAYDRDEAGNNAAEQLAKKLIAEGIDCFRVLFPKGMDANEYALQVTPANKSLGVVLRSAEWMGKGDVPELNTGCASDEIIDTETGEILTVPESAAEVESNPSLAAKEKNIPEPTTASPQPKPADAIEADISEHEVNMVFGDRQYRIRGLQKNLSFEVLKVNVLVRRGDAFHVDALELYNAKQRAAYIKAASIELGLKDDILKGDLGKVLLKCEALQEQQIKQVLAPEKPEISLTESEQTAALELLKSPDLMNRILADFESCGVVGEATNTLIGYLACVSRKLDKPLAVMIQSTSAAGKSTLMDAVLALMPEEERVQYSAMTGQSLFYMGETNLKHKILAIAEEEGAEQASYALKLLQSEGVITIASTGKNETTGDMETKEYRVEGPVMLFLTTTAIDIDEELMNRCLVLSVNESRDQTQAIHAMQRQQQTLEGLLAAEDKKHIIDNHRNAQRLIQPLLVANPYAEKLSFIDDKTRTRRDHLKYLTLIRSIALLHQYQREVKTVNHNGQRIEYIEATLADIETANRLAHEVLGRTLDELPPQTRRLLNHIHQMTVEHCKAEQIKQKDYRFTRRDVRQSICWTDFQIKKHMNRLQDMEYVLIHRGGRGQSFVYELLYQGEGEDGESFVLGLTDMETLNYDEKKKPLNPNKEPSSSPQVAAKLPPGSTGKNAAKPTTAGHSEKSDKKPQKRTSSPKNNSASYDGQEAQVSRAHGSAGATRSHSEQQAVTPLAADGV
ncbi:MAG: CHC2 zinc finger domain-containing protein [Candidatus Sedimenticola sp. (ex Thyasira tokunagai)]